MSPLSTQISVSNSPLHNHNNHSLPAMLHALLTRTGAGAVILPLLDDVLESVLTLLARAQRQTATQVQQSSLLSLPSTLSLDTLSYLKILSAVVQAQAESMELLRIQPGSENKKVTSTNESSENSYYTLNNVRARLSNFIQNERKWDEFDPRKIATDEDDEHRHGNMEPDKVKEYWEKKHSDEKKENEEEEDEDSENNEVDEGTKEEQLIAR